MKNDYTRYNEIEKESLELLDWMLAEIDRREKAGSNLGQAGESLKWMFNNDKAMTIERAEARIKEEEEWNSPNLSSSRRAQLKKIMDAGKKMDESLKGIHAALLTQKLQLLNWGNKPGDS